MNSKHSTTGVMISSYQRAGTVTTGDFAMNPPTELELARRERMLREG